MPNRFIILLLLLLLKMEDVGNCQQFSIPDNRLKPLIGTWDCLGYCKMSTKLRPMDPSPVQLKFGTDGRYKKYENNILTEQGKFEFHMANKAYMYPMGWLVLFYYDAPYSQMKSHDAALFLNKQSYNFSIRFVNDTLYLASSHRIYKYVKNKNNSSGIEGE